jgi:hypothetical protein
MHIEFFLEEPSAEAFMRGFLPKLLPDSTWNPIVFQGKSDLLKNLESRLKGYKRWIPDDYRIVVLIDEDRADCRALKTKMEQAAAAAGLVTKTAAQGGQFTVLNRIAVEELEAWYIGDPQALASAYPGIPVSLGKKAKFRDPDAVAGGTWEALQRVLQRAGHFKGGIAKIELARAMAAHLEPARNRSRSFQQFLGGLASLQAQFAAGGPGGV